MTVQKRFLIKSEQNVHNNKKATLDIPYSGEVTVKRVTFSSGRDAGIADNVQMSWNVRNNVLYILPRKRTS